MDQLVNSCAVLCNKVIKKLSKLQLTRMFARKRTSIVIKTRMLQFSSKQHVINDFFCVWPEVNDTSFLSLSVIDLSLANESISP